MSAASRATSRRHTRTMETLRFAIGGLGAVSLIGCDAPEPADPPPDPSPQVVVQSSGVTELLQAVSPVDERVVWVSGHGGSYARTLDGGQSWQAGVVPGADTLQFRDVHGVSTDVAYLLSAGPGEMSRIYKTNDGGGTWALQFLNDEPEGFYDCLDFWDANRGMAYGDAVGGELRVLRTTDGGAIWERVAQDALPVAQDGEGGFAASGTCAVVMGDGRGWIGTGASSPARVLRTMNAGATWSAVETPVVAGEAAGITTLAFYDELVGLALGGDLANTDGFTDNVALTTDGGFTWTVVGRPAFAGAVYGSAVVPGAPRPTVVAVGPGGASYSVDGGTVWEELDTENWWAVGFASPSAGWMVGPDGRIAKIALY